MGGCYTALANDCCYSCLRAKIGEGEKALQLKFLNVGCGYKPLREGVNVDLVDKAQCHFDWSPQKVKLFVNGDAHALPFHDDWFDGILCSHCLEHLENPLVALKEFRRILKPGGYLVLVVPSKFYWSYSHGHIYSWDNVTLKELCLKVFPEVKVNYTKKIYDINQRYGIIINLLSRLLYLKTEVKAVCVKELLFRTK